jgi:hypothetical protein
VKCVFIDIRISSRHARFAHVGVQAPHAPKPHSRCPSTNCFDIVKKQRGRWDGVYTAPSSRENDGVIKLAARLEEHGVRVMISCSFLPIYWWRFTLAAW